LGLADKIQVQRSWFLLLQIDLSRRGLGEEDAEIIRLTLRSNPQLAVLKLGDNNLGDKGATIIASSCSKDGRHHQSLTVLDLGFNGIGDQGITEISLHMIAGNHILRNLYLSGNNFKQKGAMAIAGAILHGCSLVRLHISANKLGPAGIKVLAGAVAEMDARRQHLLQRRGGIIISAIKPPAVEELHIGDISMKTKGLVCLSQMLISNSSLRVLNLSNNEIDDRDMAIISQALAQNKGIPLTSVQLSFNKITCVGVECFMNSIWGSQTLKEVRLDNNKMQDRGAQLCSVVLGSVRLEVLDLSFNRVSTVGVKAMMKSLSENDSLRVLSLSGIPMDQNASKAVSYALAYNSSLQVFNIDSCCVGYSGQRHIVAGIVSNRNVKLRTLTGFALGRKYQYVSSYVMCSGERGIDVFCFSF
jgi:Ran GTPase-activating protein (RanGAP) involved in mRNA processing and transport